jgi:hypothetical protein
MEDLRPNNERAGLAMKLIWVVLAMEIVSLFSGYMQYSLLQEVNHGGEISMEKANANDTREQMIAIVYLITYIISAVTFIQWFRRAYFNLHQRVNFLLYTEGWAAGSWFVPILNLFRPYQIMKELYLETYKILTKNGSSRLGIFSTTTVGLWWTLWIINGIIGQVVYRVSSSAENVEELTISTIISMISNLFAIPLALVTIKVIKDYSMMEDEFYALKPGNQDELQTA